jgi:hypothetical protein
MGYPSIMTPGFVAGMAELARRLGSGRVPWADLVHPAATLAEEGFDLYPYLAAYYTFEGQGRPGYPDVHRKLANDPRAAALYTPGGRFQRSAIGSDRRRWAGRCAASPLAVPGSSIEGTSRARWPRISPRLRH